MHGWRPRGATMRSLVLKMWERAPKNYDEEGDDLYMLQNISKLLFGCCRLQMGLMGLQVAQDQVIRWNEVKNVFSALSKESMLDNGVRNHQDVDLSVKKNQRKIKKDNSHIPMRKPFLDTCCNELKLQVKKGSTNNPITFSYKQSEMVARRFRLRRWNWRRRFLYPCAAEKKPKHGQNRSWRAMLLPRLSHWRSGRTRRMIYSGGVDPLFLFSEGREWHQGRPHMSDAGS